jgi:hypothetical protein
MKPLKFDPSPGPSAIRGRDRTGHSAILTIGRTVEMLVSMAASDFPLIRFFNNPSAILINHSKLNPYED